MPKFTFSIIFIILFFVGLGITMDHLKSKESKMITVIDDNDQPINNPVLSQSTLYFVYDVTGKLCYAIATSVFVAYFISSKITAENQAKKEGELKALQAAINKDIFDSLFQTLMPEELFKVMKSQLIENELVVRRAKWHYEFTKASGDTSLLNMRLTIKYTIHNVSEREVSDSMRLINIDVPDSACNLTSAVCTFKGKETLSFREGETTTIGKVNVIEEEAAEPPQTKVELSFSVPPKSHIEMTLKFRGCYHDAITDAYFTKYPIIDGELMFQFPESYEFGFMSSFSGQLKKDIVEENKQTYELKGGVLPKQGFLFFLKKKEQKTAH